MYISREVHMGEGMKSRGDGEERGWRAGGSGSRLQIGFDRPRWWVIYQFISPFVSPFVYMYVYINIPTYILIYIHILITY